MNTTNNPWFYHNILIPCANVIARIEERGIKVDMEYLSSLIAKYDRKLTEMEETLQQLAEQAGWDAERYTEECDMAAIPDFFNPRSPYQVAHVAIDLLNMPKFRNTRTTNKKALQKWQDEKPNEFVETLIQYRQVQKLDSSFVSGMKSYIEHTERVYPSYKLHGTVSGRLSSFGPNIQQIPRDPEIRDIFTVEDGYTMINADFSQAELRMLAYLSQDKFMIDAYQSDESDLHNRMARELSDGEGFSKEDRNKAKLTNFAIVYGKTADGLADEIGVSQDRAQGLIDFWYEQASDAKKYLDKVGQRPEKGKILESVFGRRRRFPFIKDSNHRDKVRRKARNYIVQSPASDLHLLASIPLHEQFQDMRADIIQLMHDSILIRCHNDIVDRVSEMTQNIMQQKAESALDADIPFLTDVEIGDRWGSLEEVT